MSANAHEESKRMQFKSCSLVHGGVMLVHILAEGSGIALPQPKQPGKQVKQKI